MNGLVQDGCKWLFRLNLFSFKSAWSFACAFQFSRKTFSCIFFGWNALVPLSCVHCAYFNILSSFFSETKCKPAKKITGRTTFYYLIQKHMQKFGYFWRKRKFTQKSHQAIQLHKEINKQENKEKLTSIYLFSHPKRLTWSVACHLEVKRYSGQETTTPFIHAWKVFVMRHTCDRVSFFSSSSSCSVFCSLSLILSNSSSISLFSFSVMPGLVSTVTAPKDFTGAAEITIPFMWVECSPCRLDKWAMTYSWLTNDFVQYGHCKMNWKD